MFTLFPRLIFREKKLVFSKEELKDKLEEGSLSNKICYVSLFAFSEWYNSEPLEESVMVDTILLSGSKSLLETFADSNPYPAILTYDGKEYLLWVSRDATFEELQLMIVPGLKIEKDIRKMVVFPGTVDFKTGKKVEVVRTWKK